MADLNQDFFYGEEEEARKLDCSNWLEDTRDRGRWRRSHEDAKAHPGL